MTHEEIKHLLYQASLLGAKGQIVIDFIEPMTATCGAPTLIVKPVEHNTSATI